MPTRADLLEAVSDTPRTLVLRALLQDPSTTIAGERENGVVFSAAEDIGFVWGLPSPDQLTRARRWITTLLTVQLPETLAPDLQWEKIALYVNEVTPTAPTEGVRLLQPGEAPRLLRQELLSAEERGPVYVSLADKVPAAFAFIRFQTEHYFEVWVHCLERFRKQGHAQRAASALIADRQRAGQVAVWSARELDPVAKALAERLGFRESDTIFQGRRRS